MAPFALWPTEIVGLSLDNLCCLWNLRQTLIVEASRVLIGIGTLTGEVRVFPFAPILCTILFRMLP